MTGKRSVDKGTVDAAYQDRVANIGEMRAAHKTRGEGKPAKAA